jgi:uncharacterized damage-inducible protein DinB
MSRSKVSTIVAMFALMLGLSASVVRAQEAAAMPAGVKGDMLTWYKDAESKLIQLAEATPEEKYAWRPSKDVRSTGDVFMHVAAANYGIPTFWGMKAPAGFDFATYEKSLSKKADIVQALKASFASMEQGFMATPDADLDKPAEFFGMKTTVRGGYLLLLSHSHEHLGQSIAYARMNGIVPPWTAKQQEALRAMEAKKKADAK